MKITYKDPQTQNLLHKQTSVIVKNEKQFPESPEVTEDLGQHASFITSVNKQGAIFTFQGFSRELDSQCNFSGIQIKFEVFTEAGLSLGSCSVDSSQIIDLQDQARELTLPLYLDT